MKKNKFKIISILLIILSIVSIGINGYAHSGRTDANGGHRDNKNKSGLGSYHYHCGGYPAHLHTNGVCPYTSNSLNNESTLPSNNSSSSNNSNSSSSSSSNKEPTNTTTTTVAVTGIQIEKNVGNIEVGKSEVLTAIITPSNATDKSISWESSDESIATVNSKGEVVAQKAGTVNITATTSNGKTSTIKINIIEQSKAENNNNIIKTSTSSNNTANNITKNNQETSNPLIGILTLGVLGGGGYWGYKKYKNKRK